MINFIYIFFYCAVGNDGTGSKHGMVVYGMEIITTQILAFFTFILIGLLNLRIKIFLVWVLIMSANAIIAYFSVNYYIKPERYDRISEKYANTTNRKKILYKIILIFVMAISFVTMFAGGIMMGYLLSLHSK